MSLFSFTRNARNFNANNEALSDFFGKTARLDIKRNTRAKRMRISVYPEGRVLVTLPKRASVKSAKRFLEEHEAWIIKKLQQFENTPTKTVEERRREYLQHKENARAFLESRISVLNRHYHFRFGKISVRDQKTRWGSCSSRGNLSFHYKILFLPEDLADYVIAHELCHLKELNHSPRFWDLVARAVPDHREKKKALRKMT